MAERKPGTERKPGAEHKPVYYGDYLRLDQLLSCQHPESARLGKPAHDEMIFITVHQAYELWFKQIIYELDGVQAAFAGPVLDDRAMTPVVRSLDRVREILRLLIQQIDVLETMTPLDFLDFRDLLYPASGFQSWQFRLIEMRLGLRAGQRVSYDGKGFGGRLNAEDRTRLTKAEAEPKLIEQLDAWLQRTPFLNHEGWTFEEVYRDAVRGQLEADAAKLAANRTLATSQREAQLKRLERELARFDALFDEASYEALRRDGQWHMSRQALQAALLITLYRDEPACQQPFRLLSLLMDIDEEMTTWRNRHALMVQRMIGSRIGTGGSSGHDYLRATAEEHQVFGDLFALSTFLIARSALPRLPDNLRRAMGFSYEDAPGTA